MKLKTLSLPLFVLVYAVSSSRYVSFLRTVLVAKHVLHSHQEELATSSDEGDRKGDDVKSVAIHIVTHIKKTVFVSALGMVKQHNAKFGNYNTYGNPVSGSIRFKVIEGVAGKLDNSM